MVLSAIWIMYSTLLYYNRKLYLGLIVSSRMNNACLYCFSSVFPFYVLTSSFCAFRYIFFSIFCSIAVFPKSLFHSMAWHSCGASMNETLNRQEKIICYFVNSSTDNIGYMLMIVEQYFPLYSTRSGLFFKRWRLCRTFMFCFVRIDGFFVFATHFFLRQI